MRDTLDILQTEDSITHYGVMGMKWGHRKQMAQSMGITRKAFNKNLRADNKEAFLRGREATIADNALAIANKKLAKAQAKSRKNPTSSKQLQKTARRAFATALAEQRVKKARAAMESHRKELISKYGETHISDIKKDKHGLTNERIYEKGKGRVAYAIANFASAAALLMGAPVGIIQIHGGGKKSLARNAYGAMYDTAKTVVHVPKEKK